jgi:single-strand DNA-binding protein
MAGSINKVILVGNLGGEPTVRQTRDGKPIVTLSVATSESWKDKQTGERKERTEWHRVTIFSEGLAKVAEQYLHKGSKVYIEGQMQTRKFEDQGVERYSTFVALQGFDGKLLMLDPPGQRQESSNLSTRQPVAKVGSFASDLDDEIPFAPDVR